MAFVSETSDLQKTFERIQSLTEVLREKREEVKEKLEEDKAYNEAQSKLDELEEEMKALKLEKKAVVEQFKAKNQKDFDDVDNLKENLGIEKEKFADQFLKAHKDGKSVAIYREKNGKKVRMGVILTPKITKLPKDAQADEVEENLK